MKVVLWLLDISYEVTDETAEVWLWGIDDSGKRILVKDKNFMDYFYAVLEINADAQQIAENIKGIKEFAIAKVEIVDHRFFGKPAMAIKVFCSNPNDKSRIAKMLRKVEGVTDCLEDDIRMTMRYLIDNDVSPCGWHETEVTEHDPVPGACVDKVFVAESAPRKIEKTAVPDFRIMGFSMVCYSRGGSPKPDRNPVVVISTVTADGKKEQFVANEKREDKPVLEGFVRFVREYDPDLIVGYGVNERDWTYLKDRCKRLKVRLFVDRTLTEPHKSIYGHVSVTGRANVDLADFADEFQEVKVKTLENLADYLAVKLADHVVVEDVEFADYWDDQAKRKVLLKFSSDNACRVMGVAEAILDFALQLSYLVGLPLDHVGTAAAGFRVEWFLIKQTHALGELVPKRIEQPYRPYAGAIVLQPKPGLRDDVAVLDFKSMYPSLMINYNLSPDSYVGPDETVSADAVFVAPEVGYKFRKEPAGFYKQALSFLIAVRKDIRVKLKKLDRKSAAFRVLDARQKAVKVLTNASYGYAGWVGARWYAKPVAESAAAWGRDAIQCAIQMAKDAGLEVVYGDTDSIFVRNERQKVEELLGEIQKKLNLEVDTDKVYVRVFFTEAKKRYAGLLSDGHLDIVGLEVMRGDWAAVAKNVQEGVLEIVLKEKSPNKAAEYVKQFIYELRQCRAPYRDLVIWKTLTKPSEEYEVKAAHVEAAKMLKEKGWRMSIGDKVGYVVVKGSGLLYEKVKPYVFAKYDDVDIEYYVSKQVVPAAARILSSFGIGEEQLLLGKTEGKETRRLTDFFGSG
jgi:DNA polymerase, archaea type